MFDSLFRQPPKLRPKKNDAATRDFLRRLTRHVLKKTGVQFKEYKKSTALPLPPPCLPAVQMKASLEKRATTRSFASKKASLQDISTILGYGFGLNKSGKEDSRRYYPSAGGKYPLECYLVNRSSATAKDVYHYNLRHHSLELLKKNLTFDWSEYVPQFSESNPSFIIVMTAVLKRTTQKYGIRGERYALLEAGHVGQTLQLVTTSLAMNAVPVGGGYSENRIADLIGISRKTEPVVYMFAVGYATT